MLTVDRMKSYLLKYWRQNAVFFFSQVYYVIIYLNSTGVNIINGVTTEIPETIKCLEKCHVETKATWERIQQIFLRLNRVEIEVELSEMKRTRIQA